MFRKNPLQKIAVTIGIMTLAFGLAFAGAHKGAAISPDEALQKLLAGNKRYLANQPTGAKGADAVARSALATSQQPYAIILSCSDSRVPPELLFDNGLGEIFVVRVAGNVPDPVVLGSIEYAAEHLGSPLIMVLGHERCGAVKATVDAKGQSSGSDNIDAIVKAIAPNLKPATRDCAACGGEKNCAETKSSELVECLVDANAKAVATSLTKRSKILRHLADAKKIRIVAAKYDLDDGTVTLFE